MRHIVRAKLLLTTMLTVMISPSWAASGDPSWGYKNQSWAEIKDTLSTQPVPLNYPYGTCGVGSHQAPVDIQGSASTARLNRPNPRYIPGLPTFYNTGYSVQVNTEEGYLGSVAIGNDVFSLIQFHFHAPSEHTFNGRHYDAELHFVNIREDGKAAVMTSMIMVGAANAEFQKILDNVPTAAGQKNSTSGVRLNPNLLLPTNRRQFFTYAGSLTTPPCAEGINFYIFAKPITISSDQLAGLKRLYDNNNRMTQPLNGRVLTSTKTGGMGQ